MSRYVITFTYVQQHECAWKIQQIRRPACAFTAIRNRGFCVWRWLDEAMDWLCHGTDIHSRWALRLARISPPEACQISSITKRQHCTSKPAIIINVPEVSERWELTNTYMRISLMLLTLKVTWFCLSDSYAHHSKSASLGSMDLWGLILPVSPAEQLRWQWAHRLNRVRNRKIWKLIWNQ